MTNKSSKHVVFEEKNRPKCFANCPRLIYDEPYVFQVRSQRPSARFYPCENCLKIAHKQRASSANHQHTKGCSRLPLTSYEFEQFDRPRTSNDCNWKNFMKNKSRYAIQTPYASCSLTPYEQELENRPAFVNYGIKRTFNSLAVHQMKHREVNDERARSFIREQRLRQQAQRHFREMQKRNYSSADD